MKELNHHLETEKASRTDLEMYVAVLNTQKNVLQEDADKLRQELQEGKLFVHMVTVTGRSGAIPKRSVMIDKWKSNVYAL